MIAHSNKSKQYLVFALKVLVLCLTFGYIYVKMMSGEQLSFNDFIHNTDYKGSQLVSFIFLFITLALINWLFEILKWKTIVSHLHKISFLDAAKQSLSALTVSLATPNRIGEYGAKAYFFPKQKRKQILLLNFFSNAAQMGVTTFFGIIGLMILSQTYVLPLSSFKIILVLISIIILFLLGFVFKEKELLISGFSIENVIGYFKKVSKNIKLKVILFSVFRYLAFCYLFYLLFHFFGAELSLQQAAPLITSLYLLSSILPTIFMFDVVIKGGISLWLFSMAGLEELIILSTVLAMWLLNFVIPAVLGSIFVLGYKSPKE